MSSRTLRSLRLIYLSAAGRGGNKKSKIKEGEKSADIIFLGKNEGKPSRRGPGQKAPLRGRQTWDGWPGPPQP